MSNANSSSSAKVEIYSSMLCPYCHAAKRLLDSKGIEYTVIGVDGRRDVRTQMIERANGRTSVPQVFVNDEGLGGYDDISALDQQGKLDAALGLAAN